MPNPGKFQSVTPGATDHDFKFTVKGIQIKNERGH